MKHIEVIKVTISHLHQLQKISRQTFTETFSASNSVENMTQYLTEALSEKKLTTELENKNSEFYFALHESQVIGYLKVNFGEAQTELKNLNALEIERIYILKDQQGKNVGQMLYEKAIAIAREKSVNYVWLGVWEENLRAIGFYKKNGFVEFDRHVFKLGNDIQTDIMMKLQL